MSRVSQMLQTSTGSFSSSFLLAAIMLIVGAGLTFTLKRHPKPAAVPAGAIFEPQLGFTMADGGEKIEKKDKE